MKILLIITKAEIGGAQAFVLNLAKGLKDQGKEVAVAAGEGDFLPPKLTKHNIPFFRLNSLRRSHNPFLIFSFIFELKKLIKQEKFSIIHLNSTNTLPGVISARLISKKIKTIFTIHGLSVLDKRFPGNFIVNFLLKNYVKFFLKFTDNIVFVSNDNYQAAKSEKLTNSKNIIYYALDLGSDYFLDKYQARKKLEKITNFNLEGFFVMGSIGRLAAQKNYQYLLNNWSKIKNIKNNIKLLIIGEGPDRGKYEKIIKNNNLENDIFLPGEQVNASRLLKGFDLFVLSSIYEGLPISLIETQLAQVPALASDVGGNREVIGDGNCFQLENFSQFLEKLEKEIIFQDNRHLFLIEKMTTKYLKVYEF